MALIDTPGDPSRRREVITALASVDAVILVLSGQRDEWTRATEAGEWQEYIKLIRGTDNDFNVFIIINKVEGKEALSSFMRAAMPVRRYLEATLFGGSAPDRSKLKAMGMKNYNP